MILKITRPSGTEYRQVEYFFMSYDTLSVRFGSVRNTTTIQGKREPSGVSEDVRTDFSLYTDEMHILDGIVLLVPDPEEEA